MKETHDSSVRAFWILWSGQAVSLVGSNAVQFALVWWLTLHTASAAVLAAGTFLGLVPQIVLGPVIGAWVDRFDRKAIMLAADAAVAAAALGLAALFVAGSAHTTHVLILLFVRALGSAFHAPAMLASTSLMVPERLLTRIQGLNQSLQGGQAIISAPLGALLVGVLPMAGVMAVDVATALVAIVPLIFIRVPQPEAATSADADSTWAGMIEGLRYVANTRGHGSLLGLAAAVNLFLVPAFTLLPLLVVEIGGGASELGAMSFVFGVGAVVGGIVLGLWGGFENRIHTTLVGLVWLGLATLGLGMAPGIAAAVVAIAGVGLASPLVNGPIQALLQATVPPAMQGRVFALYTSGCALMTPVGLVLAAPVADLVGVRTWYLLGGLACALGGLIGYGVPSLQHLQRAEDRCPETAGPGIGNGA